MFAARYPRGAIVTGTGEECSNLSAVLPMTIRPGSTSAEEPTTRVLPLEVLEQVDGDLVLRIPLAFGGQALHDFGKGISTIEGDTVKIAIPDWLAERLKIRDGSEVIVDNSEGKLNINPVPTPGRTVAQLVADLKAWSE